MSDDKKNFDKYKESSDKTILSIFFFFSISIILTFFSILTKNDLALYIFGAIDAFFAALLGTVSILLIRKYINEEKNHTELPKKEEKPADRKIRHESYMLSILVIILCLSTIEILLISFSNWAINLAFIVIYGVIALLVSLTIASYVFNCLHLGTKNEALGLPAGSIRAIIALSLIIIFAITVVFMESNLQIDPQQLPANSTVIWPNGTITQHANSTLLLEPTQAQKDFSLQTLTTISTLVVAVAGFYFGTKSVAVARGEEEPELSANPTGKINLKFDEELIILLKAKPEFEAYRSEIIGDNENCLTQIGNKFTYKAKEPKEKVTIKFSLIKYPEVTQTLEITIVKKEENKLDVIEPTQDPKVEPNGKLKIKLKTTPENEDVNGQIAEGSKGVIEKVKDTKAEFEFKAAKDSTTDEKITLIFTLDKDSNIKKTLEVTIVKGEENKLEVIDPVQDAKVKPGEELKIKLKTTPENKQVKGEIAVASKGELKKVKNTKAEFEFKAANDCKAGDKINLNFTLEEDPKIKKTLEITID